MKWILALMMLSGIGSSAFAAPADQTTETQKPAADTNKAGLAYKGINLQFGGFLASETVYRSNNMASDIGTSYAKIPFANSVGAGMGEFRGSARQSRFTILAQGDVDSSTHLTGYYELDFLGAATTSNSNESNSFAPRTRNVYLTADWDDSGWHLLAGQSWSLATLNNHGITPRNEFIPATIDAQYEVGFNWARQWQLRITKDWNRIFWAALSFENAQTTQAAAAGSLAAGTGNNFSAGTGNLMSNAVSFNSYPDLIAKLAWESGFGHYEVYGLTRNFQSRYGGASAPYQTNKQSSWTDSIGAGMIVPVFPKVIDIALSGLYGKGIGRYGTSGLSDVTYGDNGSLRPLTGLQYLAQLAWHTSSTWETYASYGREQLNSAVGFAGDGYGDAIVATNAGCNAQGGTCAPLIKNISQENIGFWWSFYKGNYGAAKLGAQYSYTTLNTYSDAVAGYAPSTHENIVLTSLRYYPF